MYVLYLIDSLVPAGAERSLLAMAPEYRRLGVRLDVVYLEPRPGLQADLAAAGARVDQVQASGRLARVREVRRLLVGRGPDLLHTTLFESDVVGRTAALRSRVRSVTSLVSDSYGPGHVHDAGLPRWKVRGAQVLDAVTARQASRFHAITAYVADVCSARLRIPRSRIDVIPRGREPARLGVASRERRAAARASLGVGAGTQLVVAVARQERAKGLDRLLEAHVVVRTHHPGAVLVVAGREGNQSAELGAQADRLGLGDSVRFLGVRDDVPDLLCAADVFVLPSRWEGLGGVLLEAMAVEAPIVASDLPAVREIVEDGVTGVLVDAADPRRLAQAVTGVLDDRPGAAARAAAARSVFLERYTVDRVAEAMVAFYRRALGQS